MDWLGQLFDMYKKASPPSRVARPLGSWLEVFGGKPSAAWTLALRLALKMWGQKEDKKRLDWKPSWCHKEERWRSPEGCHRHRCTRRWTHRHTQEQKGCLPPLSTRSGGAKVSTTSCWLSVKDNFTWFQKWLIYLTGYFFLYLCPVGSWGYWPAGSKEKWGTSRH